MLGHCRPAAKAAFESSGVGFETASEAAIIEILIGAATVSVSPGADVAMVTLVLGAVNAAPASDLHVEGKGPIFRGANSAIKNANMNN